MSKRPYDEIIAEKELFARHADAVCAENRILHERVKRLMDALEKAKDALYIYEDIEGFSEPNAAMKALTEIKRIEKGSDVK